MCGQHCMFEPLEHDPTAGMTISLAPPQLVRAWAPGPLGRDDNFPRRTASTSTIRPSDQGIAWSVACVGHGARRSPRLSETSFTSRCSARQDYVQVATRVSRFPPLAVEVLRCKKAHGRPSKDVDYIYHISSSGELNDFEIDKTSSHKAPAKVSFFNRYRLLRKVSRRPAGLYL